jgi:hypothetical protein
MLQKYVSIDLKGARGAGEKSSRWALKPKGSKRDPQDIFGPQPQLIRRR